MTAIKVNDSPRLEGDFSESLKDFVSKCLIKDPELRPTAEDLKQNHPIGRNKEWISTLIDLLQLPVKESSIEETKHEPWFASIKSEQSFDSSHQTVMCKKQKIRI